MAEKSILLGSQYIIGKPLFYGIKQKNVLLLGKIREMMESTYLYG